MLKGIDGKKWEGRVRARWKVEKEGWKGMIGCRRKGAECRWRDERYREVKAVEKKGEGCRRKGVEGCRV